mmetsp:Transcript_14102/g.38951  ORF Transcript_14102/g.38951 Transcript_14102/m.38951 type:complete len:657 (-) Transcript_14102:1020-2990(-)
MAESGNEGLVALEHALEAEHIVAGEDGSVTEEEIDMGPEFGVHGAASGVRRSSRNQGPMEPPVAFAEPPTMADNEAPVPPAAFAVGQEDYSPGVITHGAYNVPGENQTAALCDIAIATMRQNIVSASTMRTYIGDALAFVRWCVSNPQHDLLTASFSTQMEQMEAVIPNERKRQRSTRITSTFRSCLENAPAEPILKLQNLTPEIFMTHVSALRNPRTNKYLSPSSYGNRRAMINHMFRIHHRNGMPDEFKEELCTLYKGFYRTLAKDVGESSDPSSGKEPMSKAIYLKIGQWLLEWGTEDGVFAFCYLVLTWNLMCRVKNTAMLRFSHIQWIKFDSMEIAFMHSKTDQLGVEKQFKRNVYGNHKEPLASPVFALAVYLSTCIQTPQSPEGKLFPGSKQEDRFANILAKVVEMHKSELNSMGLVPSQIGTHSIRKGAISYAASMPGGPGSASICIRAGWTMGKVKDIYMRFVNNGDAFVGRTLTLLPLLDAEFGSSSPHFAERLPGVEPGFKERLVESHFPMFKRVEHFGRMKEMLMASLLYHRNKIRSLPNNHCILGRMDFLRNRSVMQWLETNANAVKVSLPWDRIDEDFHGIPGSIKALHEMASLKEGQTREGSGELLADGAGEPSKGKEDAKRSGQNPSSVSGGKRSFRSAS